MQANHTNAFYHYKPFSSTVTHTFAHYISVFRKISKVFFRYFVITIAIHAHFCTFSHAYAHFFARSAGSLGREERFARPRTAAPQAGFRAVMASGPGECPPWNAARRRGKRFCSGRYGAVRQTGGRESMRPGTSAPLCAAAEAPRVPGHGKLSRRESALPLSSAPGLRPSGKRPLPKTPKVTYKPSLPIE